MARTKKEVVETGLFKPTGFICPNCILDIAKQLTKEELIKLLSLLSGAVEEDIDSLKKIGLVDDDGNIVWRDPSKESIKLVKRGAPRVYHVQDQEVGNPYDILNSLSEVLQSLWGFHATFLKSKNIPVSEAHLVSWINKMTVLMDQPGFEKAIETCYNRKLGSPKIVESIMKNNQQQRSWQDQFDA